ncbi:hypothetical protein CONCODRAFT_7968 [Conidiobolus coronatus NRRL 28638]|uniref:Uncharacterized protein n=1 Tax=Conidiobolus coronatus (strain ATCC 28846 / CBS 209.66 / NRRL 28638) TaxID=796925 RepID=A0A137P3F6_CONC2|nr:hypothetical protein CONCODRAFT_7968 [Conidiobolus coronatus NRRL 28638]|eukprot:KXN69557.1 hypothetical protein CONCODRAFT_7968 [Conidiobolus coronatus NRRL 28638]
MSTVKGLTPPAYNSSFFRTAFGLVSLHMSDRIRFVQFSEEDINVIRTTIQRFWAKGIQEERSYSVSYEFKLYGYPWSATGEETMKTRMLILKLVELLELHGWSLYASIDQNSGPAGDSTYSEVDSWYCVKSTSWNPRSIVKGYNHESSGLDNPKS